MGQRVRQLVGRVVIVAVLSPRGTFIKEMAVISGLGVGHASRVRRELSFFVLATEKETKNTFKGITFSIFYIYLFIFNINLLARIPVCRENRNVLINARK